MTSNARCGPSAATATPPAARPSSCAPPEAIVDTERPRTYASPVSTSATSRLEAPLKTGVPTATAATSVSASQVGSGSRASAAAVAHSTT